jgi:thiamine-phosphate pyrophosphorylase
MPVADAPRLCLMTPPLAAAEAFLPKIEAALAAADVASLLLRLAAPGGPDAEAIARVIAGPAQARGVALVVEASPELALAAGADGVHVRYCAPGGPQALKAAVKRLSPGRIVGAGALETRDDAMTAGELGADYLLFGDGASPDFDALTERVAWWAELFGTPCVALATSLERIEPLVAAGADFVALDEGVWDDPRGPGAAAAAAAERIERTAEKRERIA